MTTNRGAAGDRATRVALYTYGGLGVSLFSVFCGVLHGSFAYGVMVAAIAAIEVLLFAKLLSCADDHRLKQWKKAAFGCALFCGGGSSSILALLMGNFVPWFVPFLLVGLPISILGFVLGLTISRAVR